jgi:hypothetical protein
LLFQEVVLQQLNLAQGRSISHWDANVIGKYLGSYIEPTSCLTGMHFLLQLDYLKLIFTSFA